MKLFSKGSEVLLKYIASFVLVLILPMTVMFFFVYSRFYQVLHEEVLNNSLSSITQVKNMIEPRIKEIYKIPFDVENDPDLRPYNLSTPGYNYIIARDKIKKITDANEYIGAVVLFIKGQDIIITNKGTLSNFYSFGNEISQFNDLLNGNLLNEENSIKRPIVKTEDIVDLFGDSYIHKYTSFLFPLPIRSENPYGALILMLDCNVIESNIAREYGENIKGVLILNGEDKIIYSDINSEQLKPETIVSYIDGKSNVTKIISIEQVKYCVSYVKSADTDWTYINIIPYNNIMKKLADLRTSFFLILLALLVAGSIIIFLLIRVNYLPIKKLKEQAQVILGSNLRFNEIEMISNVINDLSCDVDQLSNKLKANRPAIKDFLISSLFNKRFNHIEDFNSMGRDWNITLNKPFFTVAIVHFLRYEINLDIDHIVTIIENMLTRMTCYGKIGGEKSRIELLVSMDQEVITECLELFYNFVNELESKFNVEVIVGLGGIYGDVSLVGKSYLESSIAVDYRPFSEDKKIITYEYVLAHAMSSINVESSISSFLHQFEMILIRKDIKALLKFPTLLINRVKRNNLPIFRVRSLIFDIIQVIITNIKDDRKLFSLNKEKYLETTTFAKCQSINEVKEILDKLCYDVSKHLIDSENKKGEDELTHSIINYINKNFTKPTFSLQNMAEYFQMSPSRLSQYFKDNENITLIEYINTLKMEKAKEMLCNKEMTLQQISEEIGYCNPSSFIRIFKKMEGITPGQFRSMTLKHNN